MVRASVCAGAVCAHKGLALDPGSLALQLQNVGLVLQTARREGVAAPCVPGSGPHPPGSSLMPPSPACSLAFLCPAEPPGMHHPRWPASLVPASGLQVAKNNNVADKSHHHHRDRAQDVLGGPRPGSQ